MKILLTRYRRLCALVVLSLALHLLAIVGLGRHATPPARVAVAPAPLALRLQHPAAPASRAPVDSAAPAAVRPRPRPVGAAEAPAQQPAPVMPPPAPTPAAPPQAVAAAPLTPPPVPPPMSSSEPERPVSADAAPGRYRARMPPPATLDYVFTAQDGVQRPAQIAWQAHGNTYQIAADGVIGAASSSGSVGDTGIEPQQSALRRANGDQVAASFAPGAISIDGRAYGNGIGSQDPASLLLQLAGMGLAAPEQISGTVAMLVATPDGPLVMRFEVMENEALATPLGTLATRHLVQLVSPGQARLEIWLAPERGWLPVQLRLVAPDGATSTQTIDSIATAASPGP